MGVFTKTKNINKMRINNQIILFALIALFSNQLSAQCDSVLQIGGKKQLVLKSTGGESPQATGYVELSSIKGGDLLVKLINVKDAQIEQSHTVNYTEVLNLKPNDTRDLAVTIPLPEAAGLYVGTLLIVDTNGKCTWSVPVRLDTRAAGEDYEIPQDDQNVVVNTVPPSWFASLLPSKISQKGISFRISNKSAYPGAITRISLSLRGTNSQKALTEEDFELNTEDLNLAPKELRVFQFSPKPSTKIGADEYKGQLQVYLEDRVEPLTEAVTFNRRSSVGWALVLIMLGIFVGRLLKDLNRAAPQLDLMDRLVKNKLKLADVLDAPAKQALQREYAEIEKDLDDVIGEDGKESLMARIVALETKIKRLFAWQERRSTLLKTFSNNLPSWAEEGLQTLRQAIFSNDNDAYEQAKANLEQQSLQTQGLIGSRNLESLEPAAPILTNPVPAPQAEAPKSPTIWQKIETFLLKALALLSGNTITARTRYFLFRPFASLIALIFFTLFGLQEIYINGSPTFGVEGVYDYLKLFFWGTISDVVSRSLVGNPQLGQLAGNPAQSEG